MIKADGHSLVISQIFINKFSTKFTYDPILKPTNMTWKNNILPVQGVATKLHRSRWLCTSPALTVMMWGVKLAPTEHATHSPTRGSHKKISDVVILTSWNYWKRIICHKGNRKIMQRIGEISKYYRLNCQLSFA